MTFEPAEGTNVKYAAKKTALEMGRDYVGIAVVLVPDSNQLLCMDYPLYRIYAGSDEYVLDKCVWD